MNQAERIADMDNSGKLQYFRVPISLPLNLVPRQNNEKHSRAIPPEFPYAFLLTFSSSLRFPIINLQNKGFSLLVLLQISLQIISPFYFQTSSSVSTSLFLLFITNSLPFSHSRPLHLSLCAFWFISTLILFYLRFSRVLFVSHFLSSLFSSIILFRSLYSHFSSWQNSHLVFWVSRCYQYISFSLPFVLVNASTFILFLFIDYIFIARTRS